MSKRKYTTGRVVIVIVESVLVVLAILYLAEYFGWNLVREAGGGAIL